MSAGPVPVFDCDRMDRDIIIYYYREGMLLANHTKSGGRIRSEIDPVIIRYDYAFLNGVVPIAG